MTAYETIRKLLEFNSNMEVMIQNPVGKNSELFVDQIGVEIDEDTGEEVIVVGYC